MESLTRQEIALLMEAVERWEEPNIGAELAEQTLVSAVHATIHEASHLEAFNEQIRRRSDRRLKEFEVRKERGILLRAKLIKMRDQLDASELASESPSVQ